MASRGRPRPRRDPLEPPWWFNLMVFALAGLAIVLALWPLGYASHVIWRWLLHGWLAA